MIDLPIHGANAAPTDPNDLLATGLSQLLGDAVSPECTLQDLRFMTAYMGTDFADAAGACMLGGAGNRGSCPPGGLEELVNEYPTRFAMVKAMAGNCGKSNPSDSSPPTPGTPPSSS
ncbi:predicted protein [Lichtheimia corymbifera JMRC:FSU:9682]|uniref:Uncharacterized protein n=1 Tax=Lichtheimia corymbifera JMRC:FSU:9682 TaxID=1263082 RepID=A0A068S974_9FUNG|nr:predicted protein [Lichtheimia corymbifera JMRC:FSU:9682]